MLKFFLLLLFSFCATVHADWAEDALCDPAVANQNMVPIFDIRANGTNPFTIISKGSAGERGNASETLNRVLYSAVFLA